MLVVTDIEYSLNKTSPDCLDLPRETVTNFLFQNETGTPKGIVRPDFVFNSTKHVYVTSEGAEAYKTIYDKIYSEYDYDLKLFNFELIVYDETEYFRDSGE